MQQLDFFHKNSEDFLYSEIQKVRHSMDKRSRALFSLVSELQSEILTLREQQQKEKTVED